MQYWGDIKTVKSNLWKKLHSMKDAMKDGVLNLAQLISESTTTLIGGAPADSDYIMLEEQGSSIQSNELTQMKKTKAKPTNPYLGISTVKRLNTQRTMILYFCIMTVLMCCCLGRCLVVPLS